MSRIDGKAALVTGANRGIGRAFVEELLAAGAVKVYAGARNPDSLADLIEKSDGRVVPVALDVTKADTIKAAATAHQDVAILVNNAGVAAFEGLISADNTDPARNEMEINYFGVLNMTRAFAPILAQNDGGAIVNMSSIAGQVNFPMIGSYSASKAAVHSLTQGVRAELAAQGTLVVGVYPGPVDTDMAANLPMDKASPNTVVQIILAAIESGDEDVYPDSAAKEMHTGLLGDPKAVEKQVGEMLPV
ncbi:SDR family oxidoreductase [Pelagibius sp. Alg239-R121]|uniref:SDR family oxidoreductase n=1 Tax=Pelagibius sp. Alg239-R121 TaxID=2993448 RepID=UPI0024A7A4C5|nr:SDR family oxidoreductase [Pelagibius sp. Alg239-R121]